MEIEFDSAEPIVSSISRGGITAELGTDGRSDTIEIRMPPFIFTEHVEWAKKLCSLMGNLFEQQTGPIAGGNGKRKPVSTHVHIDVEDAQTVIAHFRNVWGICQQYCDGSRISDRLHSTYGYPQAYRVQGDALEHHWIEYRGLPNLVYPEAFGFVFGWGARLYLNRRSLDPIARLGRFFSEALRSARARSLEYINLKKAWRYPSNAGSQGGITGLPDFLSDVENDLLAREVESIRIFNLARQRQLGGILCFGNIVLVSCGRDVMEIADARSDASFARITELVRPKSSPQPDHPLQPVPRLIQNWRLADEKNCLVGVDEDMAENPRREIIKALVTKLSSMLRAVRRPRTTTRVSITEKRIVRWSEITMRRIVSGVEMGLR